MEWMIILQQVFELCIIPLLGIITVYIVQFIKTKTKELNSNNSNEVLSKYIEMLSNTICECVIATNQTYVDSLKAEGKFDTEAQKIAFNKTLDAVLAILTDDAKNYLTHIFGDLNIFLSNLIESQVKINKM